MDQGLKRVVARGVRPHVPYRNLNKVRNSLADKKIKQLLNLSDSLTLVRKQLKHMSFKEYNSQFYYNLKKDFNELKSRIEGIKKQDWFLRYKERYMAQQESRYNSRQSNGSVIWMKGRY